MFPRSGTLALPLQTVSLQPKRILVGRKVLSKKSRYSAPKTILPKGKACKHSVVLYIYSNPHDHFSDSSPSSKAKPTLRVANSGRFTNISIPLWPPISSSVKNEREQIHVRKSSPWLCSPNWPHVYNTWWKGYGKAALPWELRELLLMAIWPTKVTPPFQ